MEMVHSLGQKWECDVQMKPRKIFNRLLLTNLLGIPKAFKIINSGTRYQLFELLKSEILFSFNTISGTLLLKNIPDCSPSTLEVDGLLTFHSNEIEFTGMQVDKETQTLYYLDSSGLMIPIYNQITGWVDNAYKTIVLDINNQEIPSSLYMWLNVNAQQIV